MICEFLDEKSCKKFSEILSFLTGEECFIILFRLLRDLVVDARSLTSESSSAFCTAILAVLLRFPGIETSTLLCRTEFVVWEMGEDSAVLLELLRLKFGR